jgi:heme/copper-type cytochrome/quinol oxidase subunit 2
MDLKPRKRSITVRGRVIASPLSARHYVVGTGVLAAIIAFYLFTSVFFHTRTVCYSGNCATLTKGEVTFQSMWWAVALFIVLIMFFRNIYLMQLAEVTTGDAESNSQ